MAEFPGLMGQWSSYAAWADRALSLVGIEVHWVILQYVLGLSFLSFIAYLIYLKTGNSVWERIARTAFKAFVIVFAVGAATGTASEFGLVILWPNLTEAAGRYVYFPLYAEVFAFLLEVVFVYMTYYGWNKFSSKLLVPLLILSFIGPWYSAAMIVSVNSFMTAPTGVVPAYSPDQGYLYDQGYPKLTLAVPKELVPALDVGLLQEAGMEIKGETEDAVIVWMPARIVQRLAYEAWNGYLVKDSILAAVANPEYVQQNPEILETPVKDIVDAIMVKTIETVGVMTVTFKSPVYPASILHVLGSGITVSAFTAMAAYAIRIRRFSGEASDEDRQYWRTAFKFFAVAALVAIVLQGTLFGHSSGVAVAEWEPEKFAAMEATTDQVFSIARAVPGLEKLVAFLAYGDPNAPLPEYDKIPSDWCYCQLTYEEDAARISDCRPPLIIHYFYYAKLGMATLLGLYALLVGYYLVVRKVEPEKLPSWMLAVAPIVIVMVQLVSFFGWFVREVGRKPFTIYGIMTVDVAHTVNPASPGLVALVAVFFVVILIGLTYSVYRFLWLPGKPSKQ